ncbi:MAG TPA: thioesterase family protein, partial [Massilibacterium sp.]|nr:thioesterase family protein [Massilibacterium sp.]
VFVYFEEARIEFLKSLHLFSKEMETMVVVRDLQCDFLKEVYFDERLTVYCKVEEVGNTSIDLHYMVLNEQKDLVLTARGRLVQLSKETKLPIPWSEDVRKRLIES